jgi:hypothetical protein
MPVIPSNDLALRPGPPPAASPAPRPAVAPPAAGAADIDLASAVEQLPPNQQKALESLVCGASVQASASNAGVSRVTVSRWINHDPRFKALYEQWQAHLRRTSRARLTMLTDTAVDVVLDALNSRDAKVAMGLLKQMGVMVPRE